MRLHDHFIALVIPFPWPGNGNAASSACPQDWKIAAPENDDAALRRHLQQKYYASFLRCIHPASAKDQSKVIRCVPERAVLWTLSSVVVSVDQLEVRALPQGTGMITVLFKLNGDPDMAMLDKAAGMLRDPSVVIASEGKEFSLLDRVAALIGPWAVDASSLTAFGPNFKVFVNAVLDQQQLDDGDHDQRLFELGTGVPFGGAADPNGPTANYVNEQIASGGIKLFRDWRALALFDTFTRLALRAEDQHRIWQRDYLVIFQYVHYLRAQALLLGDRLEGMAISDVGLLDLRDQWHELLNGTDLKFISYKWLPNELFQRMVSGSQALHEIQRADERLVRSVSRFKERRARNLTRLGIVMAGVAILLLYMAFTGFF